MMSILAKNWHCVLKLLLHSSFTNMIVTLVF
jgi:hypothetical protein